MKSVEDMCVGCPTELRNCITCGLKHVTVHLCDTCGAYASYVVDGEELCPDCVRGLLYDLWDEFDLKTKCEILQKHGYGVDITPIAMTCIDNI